MYLYIFTYNFTDNIEEKVNPQPKEHILLLKVLTHSDKPVPQSQVIRLIYRPIKLPKEAALKLENERCVISLL